MVKPQKFSMIRTGRAGQKNMILSKEKSDFGMEPDRESPFSDRLHTKYQPLTVAGAGRMVSFI